MTTGTPFLIGPDEIEALRQLRELAAANPVDMRELAPRLETVAGKAAHMRQMTAQSVLLPFGYMVTFSIETGYPIGTARHMSMSSPAAERVPLREAAWMAAEALGFTGTIEQCVTWPEQLQGHGVAINVVQPVAVTSREERA